MIAGISEGMLSGCCGVLHEGVRRQIYIIRTSGARLLALINDVMDAAALRQNKLVLKQEQVRSISVQGYLFCWESEGSLDCLDCLLHLFTWVMTWHCSTSNAQCLMRVPTEVTYARPRHL